MALSPADAQSDQAALQTVAAHRVDKLRGQHRAGCADRVAVCNSAALDIDFVIASFPLSCRRSARRAPGLRTARAFARAPPAKPIDGKTRRFSYWAAAVLRPRIALTSPTPTNPTHSIAQVDNSGTTEKLVTIISSEPATKRSPRGFWDELFNTRT
jgi:hypothetical protein